MQAWPVQDAKARFSEFLDACMKEGPQMVTKRGAEAAVMVPMEEWRRLQALARPSIKQLLLSDLGRTDCLVPARTPARRRKAVALD
jgi:antitoxin Phd